MKYDCYIVDVRKKDIDKIVPALAKKNIYAKYFTDKTNSIISNNNCKLCLVALSVKPTKQIKFARKAAKLNFSEELDYLLYKIQKVLKKKQIKYRYLLLSKDVDNYANWFPSNK